MRRKLAGLFLLLLCSTAAWLVAQVVLTNTLVAGEVMPPLTLRAPTGQLRLQPDGRTPTLLVLFHSQCGHCHYQLDLLQRERARLDGVRVLLVTTEDTLPAAQISARWKALEAAPNVVWATVPADDFQRHFGAVGTPAFFAFDPRGTLVNTLRGEAKMEAILRSWR